MKKLLTLPALLLGAQVVFGMEIQIRRVKIGEDVREYVPQVHPDKTLLEKLKIFHEATDSSGQPKPNMEKFQQSKRRFIAKIDTFGLDRYFSIKTNEDVDALAQGVREGHGCKIEWFYYDTDDNSDNEGFCNVQ